MSSQNIRNWEKVLQASKAQTGATGNVTTGRDVELQQRLTKILKLSVPKMMAVI